MAGYNRTRYVEQLLEKTESLPPSFTVHLHPEYWVLNNGSKFLYHNQIASLLDDIRAQRIPVDFLELFDSARVPFYDGCMIVELLDYRPQRSREPSLKIPEKTRVVLHPNSETLWADICLMNRQNGGQWTDKDALEVEAKILLSTSQPLCLDPDPHLTRVVNSVLRMSTPTMPPSLKRKAAAMEPEEDGSEKARRSRILAFMAPQNNKSHTPSYRILDALNAFQLRNGEAGPGHISMAGHQYMNGVPRSQSAQQPHSQTPASTPTPAPVTAQGASPMDIEKTPKKVDAPPPAAFNVRQNGSNTPLPLQPTHQFVNQHPPPNQPVLNGMQPQVYPTVQAATEAAKKPMATAQHLQMPPHYQYQQQQQQQQQQSHPKNHPRPPSQPQHPQQLPPVQHQPQQRFTQSPKPPVQSNAATPALTQPTPQPYSGVQPAFQPSIPHSHFLQQPPPGARSGPGFQPANQQQPQQALYVQHQLQSQLAVARSASQSQSPHTPQAQAHTPQLANRTPQFQPRTPQQQLQQIQNQQSSPQAQAQAQLQPQPQTQPQTQTQTQAQQQQIPTHYYPQVYSHSQMNYPFWQRQGMMPASAATPQQQQQILQQQLLMQQTQQQLQAQQPQQQQVNVVGGQPIIVGSQLQQQPQQAQGSMPIITSNQQMMLTQALTNMGKMPAQAGKGKIGQKKAVPKRGGGAGR